MSNIKSCILLSTAVAALATTSHAHAQAAPPEASGESIELDDIVVTAERRSESIQRTPVAVTALDGSALASRQVTSTLNVLSNVPNLTGNNNPGQPSAVTFFIRGIGVSDSMATFDPSVGLYVDDVYVGRSTVNNFGLLDLERIEVLRGPQGTLYGRNTNGGAVKIVTAKPNDTLSGALSASFGNYDRWDLRGSLNLPLNDKVFLRANALVEQGDGYIRNITLNKAGANRDYLGGRLAIRLLPTESLTIDLSADFGRDISYGTDPVDTAGILQPLPNNLFESRTGITGFSKGRAYGFQSSVEWRVSDDVALQSITAWRTATQDIPHDQSGQPVTLYFFDNSAVSHQFSEELKLNADLSSRLRLVTGLYYFNENSKNKDFQFTRTDPAAAQVAYFRNLSVYVGSYAAFGQFEFGLTDSLKLVAAGRFTHDEKELDVTQTSSNAGPSFNYTDESIEALGTNFDAKRKFNRFTPKLGVNWQVSPDTFLYASWTQGFRSGGWTGRALRAEQFRNFDAETVSSYEIGSKLTLFDRRVRFNTSAFYMDYKNLFNTLSIAGAFTVQLADARMYGVETEITGRVAPWLDLYATGAYLNARYKSPRPANLASRLQRAPSTQGKIGADIHYPVGQGKLVANAGLFYSASYYVSPGNLAFSAPLLPVDSNLVRSYVVADAMLGYEFGENGRYLVSVSCTNCFDREYFGSITAIGRYAAVYPAPPRFYKVSAGIKF